MLSDVTQLDPSAIGRSRIGHPVRISIVLFVLALIPRMVLISSLKTAQKDDCYWELSGSLIDESEFVVRPKVPQTEYDRMKGYYFDNVPTGHRLPATPVFLAILRLVSGDSDTFVKIFHAVLTSLVSVLAYLSLRNLGKPESGILAGVIWAFWPYSLFYGHYLAFMSEPLALYCVATLTYLTTLKSVDRRIAAFGGVVLGICVANRGEGYLFAAFYLVSLAILKPQWRKYLVMMAVIAALIVAPWIYRNYRVFGHPVMNTLSGYLLWTGNNPWTNGTFPSEDSLDDPEMRYVEERFPDLWKVDEYTRSKVFGKAARDYLLETAKSDPARLVTLFGSKILYFYALPRYLEDVDSVRDLNLKGKIIEYGIVVFLTIFKTIFLYCLYKKRPNADEFFFVLPMAFILLVAILIFPTVRHEYSYDVGMILFVASRWSPKMPWVVDSGTEPANIAGPHAK